MQIRTAISVAVAVALVAGGSTARDSVIKGKSPDGPRLTLVLDGSPVHSVGELQLHMTNWGMFGSWPTSSATFSSAPSGEWPAGSGIEHLYSGALWVGAIKNGIPAVSTASFELEFRPTKDPIDVVYYSAEGAAGGNRLPHPNADDDGDGMVDEDPLDGHDNDNDGQVDEDYAAISDQMLSRWYPDNTPESQQIYPTHNPLNIEVREQTYQWEDDEFDDFIGFDYAITNIGTDVLEDVYIGIFIGIFVTAIVAHAVARLFKGRGKFEDTQKVIIYGTSPFYAFGWLPIFGVLAGLYSVIVQVPAFRALHRAKYVNSVFMVLGTMFLIGVLVGIIPFLGGVFATGYHFGIVVNSVRGIVGLILL